MSLINKKVQLGICTFIIAAFGGCATTPASAPEKYYPQIPSGITTVEAAKEDLSARLKAPAKFCIDYGETNYKSPMQDVETQKRYIRERISRLDCTSFQVDGFGGYMKIWTHSIPVDSDRIDIPFFPFFYEDLLEFDIVIDNNEIKLPSGVKLQFFSTAAKERIADDLFFIQQELKKKQVEQLTLFESQAAKYRTLKVKPPISEEQRKLSVQANAVSQTLKDYAAAIDLYKKAIGLDPVSYPGAYFNTALLYAQMQKYNNAIFYMKQHLMLEPKAKDSRRAQDKIYEWEFMIEKNRNN